jgi:hypothetical protein
MIDFKSSAIAEYLNYLTTIPPLPAGEGRGSSEHSERLTGCCSGVGELCSRGCQSALIKVGRAYSRAVPFGHSIILSKTLCLCALVPSLEEFVSISLSADSSAIARGDGGSLGKGLPRSTWRAASSSDLFAPLRLCVIYHPKSTPRCQNTGPTGLIPAHNGQKNHANLFYP